MAELLKGKVESKTMNKKDGGTWEKKFVKVGDKEYAFGKFWNPEVGTEVEFEPSTTESNGYTNYWANKPKTNKGGSSEEVMQAIKDLKVSVDNNTTAISALQADMNKLQEALSAMLGDDVK